MLPLCSSKQVIAALTKAGFAAARPAKGTHQAFEKVTEGHTITTIVVLDKKEIPRGTLRKILSLAGISDSAFLELLKTK